MAVWIVDPETQRALAKKHGFKPSDATDWYHKWRGTVRNAKARKLSCTLSLDDYLFLARKAGLRTPDQVGMAVGSYNLGRVGDTGGYVKGNCRFITSEQNRRERSTNGCFDDYSRRKANWTKDNHEGTRRMAEKAKERMSDPAFKERIVQKISKSFRLVSPTGKVFKGHNLAEFCREHELALASMAAVCRNGTTIKGWTGKYL